MRCSLPVAPFGISARKRIFLGVLNAAKVDEALMDHPAVLQVVTFAMPHDKLGEDIAAAVVLREGATATEGELRSFLSERFHRGL
jgi:non-ribosomal peptide synthetase component E (peptide arylation enzyme)